MFEVTVMMCNSLLWKLLLDVKPTTYVQGFPQCIQPHLVWHYITSASSNIIWASPPISPSQADVTSHAPGHTMPLTAAGQISSDSLKKAKLNFLVLQEEDRGVTSLPAERPVRHGGRRGAETHRAGTDAAVAAEHAAAKLGEQPARAQNKLATLQRRQTAIMRHRPPTPELMEEAVDTTSTYPRLPRLVAVCAAGRTDGWSVGLSRGDMSTLTVEEDQKWLPTHVQVTVLRGRGLRGKGKHGTSDVYTIIQLGKEKYSTCVLEKTTEPEWREECSFELHPGVLENGGRSSYPAGSNELVLIVMHRALIGMDVFLGQAVIQLDKVFHETRYVKNDPPTGARDDRLVNMREERGVHSSQWSWSLEDQRYFAVLVVWFMQR
ncbi:hypothetical protein FQN60_007196 [Etheostoma spectabile]|uniref:C2 domain-containing protein n=1 Tax=Etheostoma spectabile TaxID=54343 RepID=A0A5J5CDQ1_9PERO|nr:hypothetical protein FQN60_007196 [Etheostoma spectabile]